MPPPRRRPDRVAATPALAVLPLEVARPWLPDGGDTPAERLRILTENLEKLRPFVDPCPPRSKRRPSAVAALAADRRLGPDRLPRPTRSSIRCAPRLSLPKLSRRSVAGERQAGIRGLRCRHHGLRGDRRRRQDRFSSPAPPAAAAACRSCPMCMSSSPRSGRSHPRSAMPCT